MVLVRVIVEWEEVASLVQKGRVVFGATGKRYVLIKQIPHVSPVLRVHTVPRVFIALHVYQNISVSGVIPNPNVWTSGMEHPALYFLTLVLHIVGSSKTVRDVAE